MSIFRATGEYREGRQGVNQRQGVVPKHVVQAGIGRVLVAS